MYMYIHDCTCISSTCIVCIRALYIVYTCTCILYIAYVSTNGNSIVVDCVYNVLCIIVLEAVVYVYACTCVHTCMCM